MSKDRRIYASDSDLRARLMVLEGEPMINLRVRRTQPHTYWSVDLSMQQARSAANVLERILACYASSPESIADKQEPDQERVGEAPVAVT